MVTGRFQGCTEAHNEQGYALVVSVKLVTSATMTLTLNNFPSQYAYFEYSEILDTTQKRRLLSKTMFGYLLVILSLILFLREF